MKFLSSGFYIYKILLRSTKNYEVIFISIFMDNVQKLSPEFKNAISSLDIELLRVLLHLKENNNKGIRTGALITHLSRPNQKDFKNPRCLEITKLLLSHGVDISSKNASGITPLRLAVNTVPCLSTIMLLGDYTQQHWQDGINYCAKDGTNLLHCALYSNANRASQSATIEYLVQMKVDVN